MFRLLTILVIFNVFLQRSEAKPLLFDADYSDDDLLAEESQSIALAASPAYGSSLAFAGSSNFDSFDYGAAPGYHRPQHRPHHHQHPPHPPHPQHPHHPHTPYQSVPFAPFYPQPNFEYPHYEPEMPFHGAGKHPNFHGRPKFPLSNNNNNEKPIQMPTSTAITTSIVDVKPEESSTEILTVPSTSSSSTPTDTGNMATTAEEPIYDIDIRFKD